MDAQLEPGRGFSRRKAFSAGIATASGTHAPRICGDGVMMAKGFA